MLGVSVALWVRGSVVQWCENSDEGASTNWTEDEKGILDLQEIDEDKTKVQLQLLPDTYS